MRLVWLVLACALLAAAPVSAQTPTPVTGAQSIEFEHSDYANATRFESRVDTGVWIDAGKPPASGPQNTLRVPLPAMTPGAHALTVRACNLAGCSVASAAVNVVMVAIPSVPANLRITAP